MDDETDTAAAEDHGEASPPERGGLRKWPKWQLALLALCAGIVLAVAAYIAFDRYERNPSRLVGKDWKLVAVIERGHRYSVVEGPKRDPSRPVGPVATLRIDRDGRFESTDTVNVHGGRMKVGWGTLSPIESGGTLGGFIPGPAPAGSAYPSQVMGVIGTQPLHWKVHFGELHISGPSGTLVFKHK